MRTICRGYGRISHKKSRKRDTAEWIMLKTFVDAVLSGKEMPIDVYDMATWSSIVALTDQSIALGGAPVVVPDFTRGKWIKRPRKDVTELAINNLGFAKE